MSKPNDLDSSAPAVPSPRAEPLPAGRPTMDPALFFVHALQTDNQALVRSVRVKALALAEELAERGLVAPGALDTREAAAQAAGMRAEQERMLVWADHEPDKYGAADSVALPCAELLPLCQARCCHYSHLLSFQDLDEGRVRWDLQRPYEIRRSAGGCCVHNDPQTARCDVYVHRPASCRRYDCRGDERIWLDYEGRVPAPRPAQ